MSRCPIPFNALGPREDAGAVRAALDRVVASGRYVLGPEVEAFEAELAAAAGAACAVGVGSGTDAIALALRGLGIGPGDEVITTPLSAAFTGLAILMTGARPVFADVTPDRLTLDAAAVSAAVTPRTAAIVPVHLYGQPADMRALEAAAARHGVPIIEDCCQAHLATAEGRPVGTIGAAGALSFYPTKNLGALGDGGAVLTNDRPLADRVRRLRNGGRIDRDCHIEAGVNSRLDELQAAVLRARLPFLADWTARRRALAATYRRALAPAAGDSIAVLPQLDPGHVYHLFVIRARRRTELQAHLRQRGIETLVHYPVVMTGQPAFAASAPAPCPAAEAAGREVLSLPMYPALSGDAVARTADAVAAFAKE